MLYRCADFVLLNKIDQLEGGKVDELSQIMRSLNPLAQVITPQPHKYPDVLVNSRGVECTRLPLRPYCPPTPHQSCRSCC